MKAASIFTVCALMLAASAWATPITTTYTVSVPCAPPNEIRDSPTAVSIFRSCSSDVTKVTALAEASQGHLGVGLDASESLGGLVDSVAELSTFLTFTATAGSTATSIPVQLNLGVNGDLFASGSADVSWRLFSNDFVFDYLTQVGSDPTHRGTGIDFVTGGESLNGDVHVVSGEMQSHVVNVPVGIPVAFNLTLTVAGFGNPGSFGGDFIHSVDFPIGADVFTLPDGFTVNDADLFLVNNRFSPAPADTAVPEPSTLLLLGTGLLAARRLRRN